ncbi:condensation domain-containing protein [Pseudooceanicola nanhaiensis]|uniref:condensation domain-containing protein n=1 Tax=Pseudooceanicola nanhaiensis TaxID=375761 RepID=UPI004058CEB6
MSEDRHSQPAEATELVAEFPLSATQTRCWFLDRMQPGNPSLNVAVRWELRGQVQTANIERAFQHVIERHEILRTRFVEKDGAPVQQVVADVPFKLDTVDIRTVPEAQQMARVSDIAHEVAERPFDLGQPGLIRATLIRLAADRAILTFVVHQSCFDGASIRVLGHEIGTAAQAFEEGRAPDLPDLPLQYGDFALWQQDYFASGVLEEEGAYWEARLKDAPYFELEPDKPRPPVKTTSVEQVNLDLPEDFGPRLAAAAQAAGVSPFTYGCALFSAALARASGRDDVLFGTQIAGRLDSDLDPMIGVFINNLVLRFSAPADRPLSAQVAEAKQVVEGALTHQSMPFNRIVKRLNPRRDPSRTPLISVNFNLQQVFMETKTYGTFSLRSSPSHAPGAIYDLDLAVMGRPSGWQMNLEYSTSLFDRETAQALAELVRGAFETAFADAEAPLSAIPLPALLAERGQDDRRRISAAEHALMRHPMVREAAVIRTEDALHAFVVPQATGALPLDELPQKIMDESPDAALADLTGISIVADFPRSSTGAVNRAVLAAPKRSAKQVRSEAMDPAMLEALQDDFAEVLGAETVTPASHFFDMGGHSVLVLRLLTKIRDRWGVQLDVTQVYEHSTPADLARLVSARRSHAVTPAEDWRIMRLRKEGQGLPLIAVNNAATALALGTAGSAPRQTACVRIFDAGRGIALDDRPFEEIAADYAQVIRKAQPEGPYLLYGNCVHGNLALEAARVLRRDGAEIAGVVMKDVWEPSYTSDLPKNPKLNRQEKWHGLRSRLRAVRAGEMSFSALLGMYSITRKLGILQLGTRLGLIERVKRSDLEEDQERFISHVSRKRDAYRPAPVDFPVLHVVTGITPSGGGFSPSIGWEKIIAPEKLKTVRLPKVLVLRDKRVGVEDMAREMERFLGETGAQAEA